MKRRYVTTIIVGLLFAGMVTWVLLNERGRVAESGEVFALQLTDLSQLSLQAPDHQYTLQRRGKDWWITQPFQGLADADKVKPILEAVASLKPTARKNQDLSDPQFGLQSPVLTVTASYKGRQTAVIKLGAESPLGSMFFATIGGRSELFLIDQSFKSVLDQDPQEFHDKSVAKVDADKVNQVTVQGPAGTVTASRVPLAGQPEWEITAPRKLPADRSAVEAVVRGLGEGEALDFLPYTRDNLAATGLSEPQLAVACEGEGQPAVTVWIGKSEEREVKQPGPTGQPGKAALQRVVYVTRSGRQEILALPESYFMSLNKTLLDLRDKHVLAVKQAQIEALTVEREKGLGFKASKNGLRWELTAPQTGVANPTRMENLTTDLTDLQALSYEVEDSSQPDLSKYGLQAPQLVVTIGVQGGQPMTLSLGKAVPGEPGHYYARTSVASDVYVIDDALLRDLPQTVSDLLAPPGQFPSSMPGGAAPPRPMMPPPPGGPNE